MFYGGDSGSAVIHIKVGQGMGSCSSTFFFFFLHFINQMSESGFLAQNHFLMSYNTQDVLAGRDAPRQSCAQSKEWDRKWKRFSNK